ncbi:MAG: DMT family transporter [Alphaproteobacteria bacterium]
MSTHRNYAQAALFALTCFTGWTCSDALLKLVREENIPLGQIILISGLSGMTVVFLLSAVRGNIGRLRPIRWRGVLTLGVLQYAAFMCWMQALPHLPLANMYAVSFMTPMAVAGLAALVLKEHIGWKRAIAIATGFAGVVIAVNPLRLMGHSGEWLPYLGAFGSMAGTSMQMLMLRAVGRWESTECMSFYPRCVLVVAGLLYCLATGFVPMKLWTLLAVCASGALGGIGWGLLTNAYKNAPAASVAPFHYSQMISGALFGYFIWHDVPDAYLLCGAAVIIASGIYLVHHERRIDRTMLRAEEVLTLEQFHQLRHDSK